MLLRTHRNRRRFEFACTSNGHPPIRPDRNSTRDLVRRHKGQPTMENNVEFAHIV
ncbi:hypothetical protein CY34DRAFT_810017, partial [Suillus luteus UH-Slu-Lm8-n1]